MASLTQTAYLSRKIIKYGSIGLVVFLILRGLFLSFQTYWKKVHPAPPPPPTVAFGKLPALSFPNREGLPSLSFKLETISGTFPKQGTQAKVYFMPQPATNLLAWDNTKTWAKKLGFTRDPEATDKFAYRFSSGDSPPTILDVNVLTRNFHLYYDWKNDLGIISLGNPPQDNTAIASAKSFLQGASALTDDLSQGTAEATYLKYKSGDLIKALYYSESNFTKVNLFRANIDNLKVLPPNPKDANISIFLGPSGSRNKGILEVKYNHAPVSFENYATYPLKDVSVAWKELIDGKGFIANLGNNPQGKATVRDAYLAYYDSEEAQNFLQPVFVFEGDNEFFGYVPAISDNWREQASAK